MIAIDLPVGILIFPLASEGPSTHAPTRPKSIKVSGAEMKTLNIKGDTIHPEWNYTISPRGAN
jgi:hypothetical protein